MPKVNNKESLPVITRASERQKVIIFIIENIEIKCL